MVVPTLAIAVARCQGGSLGCPHAWHLLAMRRVLGGRAGVTSCEAASRGKLSALSCSFN